MILLKNIEVYSPKYLGKKDVLISGKSIYRIEDNIENNDLFNIVDCSNKKLIPGFIDNHVHVIGGGGEGSFKSRAPEVQLSDLIRAGITTVCGLLGTDSETRSVENLVAKSYALEEEGITAFCFTGSYGFPSKTLTNSLKKDIVFIHPIIGTKIAISDHRSSSITNDELARLASDTRVAGMISGKSGVVITHMGDGSTNLKQVFDVIDNTEIPLTTIHPTHVNRKKSLLEDAYKYANIGGYIDISAGYIDIDDEVSGVTAIKESIKRNIPQNRITISSDGQGSWSNYDDDGNLINMGVAPVDVLFKEFKKILDSNISMEDALIYFTSNVATSFNFKNKGSIKENKDADLLILDENNNINSVIALGKFLMKDNELLVKGTYE